MCKVRSHMAIWVTQKANLPLTYTILHNIISFIKRNSIWPCHSLGLCWCPSKTKPSWYQGSAYYLRAMMPQGLCQSEWPALLPETMVTSQPRLLPRTMSGSVFLPELMSILMPMSHHATKDHTDTWGLGYNLWLWGCVCGHVVTGPCWSECPTLSPRAMVLSGSELLLRAMSGPVDPQ